MLETIHATAVAVGERAVLIRGQPGSGKSDLAFRLIAMPPGRLTPEVVRLVADDQVAIERRGSRLLASAPPTIAGRLEVRGVGILSVPYVASAHVRLVVDLVDRAQVPRLPEDGEMVDIAGLALPRSRLHAFDASTPVKVALALAALDDAVASREPRV